MCSIYNNYFADELKEICQEYYERMYEAEGNKWDMEHEVSRKEWEVLALGGRILAVIRLCSSLNVCNVIWTVISVAIDWYYGASQQLPFGRHQI